ncbi:MAG: uracil-DNA glycosylase family protein [Nitrospirales bacterium]
MADDIPNPQGKINILFVGVAPPPIPTDEDDEVGHFYSNQRDKLRLGLFNVLDRIFESDLSLSNEMSLNEGTKAFIKAGYFFVHAAKVYPCNARLAPTRKIMRFCAKQHLVNEIFLLRPQGICFLGATNASPAAQAVFGKRIKEVPEQAEVHSKDRIQHWKGWVALSVQPVRGTQKGSNRERAVGVIAALWNRISNK